jgi:hypothetical protein
MSHHWRSDVLPPLRNRPRDLRHEDIDREHRRQVDQVAGAALAGSGAEAANGDVVVGLQPGHERVNMPELDGRDPSAVGRCTG